MDPYFSNDLITVYHARWHDLIDQLPQHDLLLTDPPYGIQTHVRSICPGSHRNQYCSEWDNEVPSADELAHLTETAAKSLIFGGQYMPLPSKPGWLIWCKPDMYGTNFADAELAWTSFLTNCRVVQMSTKLSTRDGRVHPTQKPVALMKACIGLAGEVSTILDPYAGSGTTGRAAMDLGLRATLIEQDEAYCEMIVERLRQLALAL